MSRIGRLFEIMITLNTKDHFTVQTLAEQFAVSRRTILRDLHLLSEMGVPLQSSTGPYGGYKLIRSQTLPAISLTQEEALGLLISYEAYEHFPDGPFEQENITTLTKIRSALSQDMLLEVDRLRNHIAIDSPQRSLRNPYLKELLQASIDRNHLKIDYDSRSKRSWRVIYPYGIFLANGLWYVMAYCFLRKAIVTFRTDRIMDLNYVKNDLQVPPNPQATVKELLKVSLKQNNRLSLQVDLTKLGCKLIDPDPTIGEQLELKPDGTGIIDTVISEEDLSWYARYFLSLGKEVRIKNPEQLIDLMKKTAGEILDIYH